MSDEDVVAPEVSALRGRLLQAELRTAAVRAGMVDLDGLKLLDTSQVTLNDRDEVVGAEALMAQMRRAKPWLFSILRNVFLHRVRTDRANQYVSLDSVGEAMAPLPEEPPEIGTEQLQRALNELPEGFRTPVILFYFEDMSYRDIAEQMALPIGTVMSRLARGKAHLRDRLSSNPGAAGSAGGTGEVSHGL